MKDWRRPRLRLVLVLLSLHEWRCFTSMNVIFASVVCGKSASSLSLPKTLWFPSAVTPLGRTVWNWRRYSVQIKVVYLSFYQNAKRSESPPIPSAQTAARSSSPPIPTLQKKVEEIQRPASPPIPTLQNKTRSDSPPIPTLQNKVRFVDIVVN